MAWGSSPSVTTGYVETIGAGGTQNFSASLTAGDTGFAVFTIYDSGVDPQGGSFKVYDNVGGSGTPWTVIWGQVTSDPTRCFIAYRENLPSGITTVSVQPKNGSGVYLGGAVFSFNGGATSSSLDNSNDGGTPGSLPFTVTSLTVGGTGRLVIACGADSPSSGGTTWTTPSGFFDIANTADSDNDNPVNVVYQVASGSGPFAPTFTPNGQTGAANGRGVIAAFIAAGGGGGGATIMGQACL